MTQVIINDGMKNIFNFDFINKLKTKSKGKMNIIQINDDIVYESSSANIEINVVGDVGKINTNGKVTVNGNVNNGIDTNGSVIITGNVNGNIDTNGKVEIGGDMIGDIDTNGKVIINGNKNN